MKRISPGAILGLPRVFSILRLPVVCLLLLLVIVGLAAESVDALVVRFDDILTLLLAVSLSCISIADLRRLEIPDLGSMFVALIGAVMWRDSPGQIGLHCLVAGAVTLLLAAIGDWAWKKTGREWLGLGDAKLIGAGILVVGAGAVWLMILLAASGGIVAALLARYKRGEGIPFGPFLAYAILITHLITGPSS